MPATVINTASQSQATRASHVFETDLGWMAVRYEHTRLCRLLFGRNSLAELLEAAWQEKVELEEPADAPPDWITELQERLERFARGEPQEFSDLEIAVDHCTPFAQAVLSECRQLGWGQVVTYAQLAERVGRPAAARAVGNVMANNRLPIIVPCHRVIGAGGGLGGYSAPGGLATKQRLLNAEGAL